MSKHTPRSWYIVLDPETDKPYMYDGCYAIHHDSNEVADGIRSEANANLIAAAPDLLEVLGAFDDLWVANPLAFEQSVPDEIRIMMSATIAKARGEKL